jgi:hypothetical protein
MLLPALRAQHLIVGAAHQFFKLAAAVIAQIFKNGHSSLQ